MLNKDLMYCATLMLYHGHCNCMYFINWPQAGSSYHSTTAIYTTKKVWLLKEYHILTGLLQNKRQAGGKNLNDRLKQSYVCLAHCALECQRRRGKRTNEEACCQRMVKPAPTKLLKIGKRARCIYCGATLHSIYPVQMK